MRQPEARLRKLEMCNGAGDIPVWCEDPADMGMAIDAMIANGDILENDRHRCVYWQDCKCPPGKHERRLAELT